MKCKKCKAPLQEGMSICPECGTFVPKKKKTVLPVWATVIISVLTVAVIVLATLFIIDKVKKDNPFKNYTGSDKQLIANADKVVAKVGEMELTGAELQVYYWVYVYSFMDENSYYLSSLGFDYSKPFHKQECTVEKGKSWQEYFINQAIDTWYQYAILVIEGQGADFKLPEEEQKYVDNIIETMNEQATEYGYKDFAAMLLKEMGAGATENAYAEYIKETFVGMGYYNFLCESVKLTDTEISKYYDDNKAYFEEYEITKDDKVYAWTTVRHILFMPKSATDSSDFTDAEWEACRIKAQALLDTLTGKTVTEEEFIALAKQHSEDEGSKEDGGLIEKFFRNEMVEEFEEWAFDATHKYGDIGMVKTTYGYHIMFFVEAQSEWYYYADSEMRTKEVQAQLTKLEEKWPLEIRWNHVLVSHVKLGT